MAKKEDYLTTTQAARLLAVSSDTVLKWVKAGKIESYRTLGGHFRIPLSALDVPETHGSNIVDSTGKSVPTASHEYCWEYFAGTEGIPPDCSECITYRSRSKRCYELRDLMDFPVCPVNETVTDCTDCEYYKLVNQQKLSIIILGKNKRMIRNWEALTESDDFQIKFAGNEYECALVIEKFRPDFIVVDCSFGGKRTADICRSLCNDQRIPVARIILSSKDRQARKDCDKEIFGWITRPFTIEQLKKCIKDVT